MLENFSSISTSYNMLPELDEADFILQNKKHECIDALLAIIVRHEKHKYVGIRLLHRHNRIDDGEIMAEFHRLDEDGFALITKATKLEDCSQNLRPNSWMLQYNEWVPMEFSNSELLKNPSINPLSCKDLFDELAVAISDFGVEAVLGPSLMGSDLIESYKPSVEHMLVEQTALDDRANVLRYAKTEINLPFKSVETHWCMEDDKEKGTTTRSCKRICPSTEYNPPKHNGTYIHQQN